MPRATLEMEVRLAPSARWVLVCINRIGRWLPMVLIQIAIRYIEQAGQYRMLNGRWRMIKKRIRAEEV